MRLLLDTHIVLWAITGDKLLPARARDLLLDPENEIWASAVNVWETAIKHARRLQTARDAVVSGSRLAELIDEAAFGMLPVSAAHAAAIDTLPAIHNDPFDRMLVAQARTEPLHLLTADATLAGYGEHILLA